MRQEFAAKISCVRGSLHPASRRFRLPLLTLACTLAIACSQDKPPATLPSNVAPGVILVDIIAGGLPENYWQYQVQPSAGTVQLVKTEQFQDYRLTDIPTTFQKPTGAIETCERNPQAPSPDGRYLAFCSHSGSLQFDLIDRQSNQTLFHWKADKGIHGFAWAPDSTSVAIVTTAGHIGFRPRELLALVSGHPVPHDTVFLEIVDVKSGARTEYTVRQDVISAFPRILSWQSSR